MRTGSSLLAALLAAAVVMAGCAGKADGVEPAGPGATTPAGIGSLLGVVVDDAVRPLSGANVTATGPSGTMEAVSDAEGRFRLDGLAAGVYLVEVSKPFYISHQQAVTVVESAEPKAARFLLTFEAASVPYANLYKYDGFYECGSYPYHLCSNVNIATWIVVCANAGVCLGNVTQDRSLFFQTVEPGADFLQGELVWTPTTSTGESLALLLGGGNEEELKAGMAPAYNASYGRSPLMLRISNHEGPDAWCRTQNTPTCTRDDVLNETGIGTERALLVQVGTGPAVSADPLCGTVSPCATGLAVQQAFTMFTITFYGYEPPSEWLFSATGELPPPPT